LIAGRQGKSLLTDQYNANSMQSAAIDDRRQREDQP